jgi:hypothetical protein
MSNTYNGVVATCWKLGPLLHKAESTDVGINVRYWGRSGHRHSITTDGRISIRCWRILLKSPFRLTNENFRLASASHARRR